MPKFLLQYHLRGDSFVPNEIVDAETIEEATAIAGERVTGDSFLTVTHGEEMLAVPKTSVLYAIVRITLERKRSVVRDYEPVEPWNTQSDDEKTES